MTKAKNVIGRWVRQARERARRRPRASILVVVVAILTLIALIGTADIATARIDRYTAGQYMTLTQLEAERARFVDQATQAAKDAIISDTQRDVTSPRVQAW